MRKLYYLDPWIYLLGILILYILIIFFIHYLYVTDDLYYQTFGDMYSIERIKNIINIGRKWEWFVYISAPAIIFFRLMYTSICLLTGLYFLNIKIPYWSILNISLKAEVVFLGGSIVTFLYQTIFMDVNTFEDLSYKPLSLLNVLDKNSLNEIFIYPISFLNVFEFLYWIILAILLTIEINKPFRETLRIVAISYGSGLFLYLLLTMFVILSVT